jgi:hypothetical protein
MSAATGHYRCRGSTSLQLLHPCRNSVPELNPSRHAFPSWNLPNSMLSISALPNLSVLSGSKSGVQVSPIPFAVFVQMSPDTHSAPSHSRTNNVSKKDSSHAAKSGTANQKCILTYCPWILPLRATYFLFETSAVGLNVTDHCSTIKPSYGTSSTRPHSTGMWRAGAVLVFVQYKKSLVDRFNVPKILYTIPSLILTMHATPCVLLHLLPYMERHR